MTRQADVALMVYSMDGGGVEHNRLTLAEAFLKRGLCVDLILCRAIGAHMAEIPKEVHVVDCRADTFWQWRKALESYLRETPPRSLLAAMEGAGVVALWARQRTKASTRIVVSSHNTISRHGAAAPGFKERFLLPWFLRWFYRNADAIVSVSVGVADDLARTVWLERNQIQVIHNPIVSDALLDKALKAPEHPWLKRKEVPVVVAAGRLTEQKDFPTLIRAFARLNASKKARLIIIGEGERRSEIEQLVTNLKLSDRVSLPGFARNPYPYFAGSDLFVLSSAWEGLPTVLVEAMACGCPVVATDCPSGPAEILDGGKYGPLVAVGDSDALAQCMADALDHPIAKIVLQERASEFGVDQIADRYMDVLRIAPTRKPFQDT